MGEMRAFEDLVGGFDWKELRTFTGTAAELPKLMRSLASAEDSKEAGRWAYLIGSAVVDQGCHVPCEPCYRGGNPDQESGARRAGSDRVIRRVRPLGGDWVGRHSGLRTEDRRKV
jgi:hypothetical protein